MKKILGILILMLVMGTIFADIQVSAYEVMPSVSRPGVKGTASLTITNRGTTTLQRVSISVQPSTGIDSSSSIYVGDMEAGGTSLVSIPFSVKETTPSGVYSLKVLIRGTQTVVGSQDNSLSRTVDIPIYVNRPPSLSISSPEEQFTIGEKFTKTITIRKEGDSALDVRLTSQNTNFILDNSPVYVGNIRDSTVDIEISGFVSSSMNAGRQSIDLIATYFDILGNEYSQTISPSFEFEEPVHILNLIAEPSEFVSGETKEVQFIIKNTGSSRLNDVELKLEETQVFIPLSGERIVLGSIGPGEEITKTTLLAIKDIDPGYYITNFDLSYTSQAGERKIDAIKRSLNIKPNIEVIIFVESSPSPLIEQGQYILSLKVSNIGDSEIKSVWFELDDTEHMKLLNAQNKQFIGSLGSDDFSSVQYDVYISGIDEDEITEMAPIKIYFKDTFNNNHIIEQTTPLKIYSKKSSQFFQQQENGILVPILIILIILGAGYWYWKKRKKNAKR